MLCLHLGRRGRSLQGKAGSQAQAPTDGGRPVARSGGARTTIPRVPGTGSCPRPRLAVGEGERHSQRGSHSSTWREESGFWWPSAVYHKGVERSYPSFPKIRQDGRSGAEADLPLVLLPWPGSPPVASAPVSSCGSCAAPACALQARKQLSLRLRQAGRPCPGEARGGELAPAGHDHLAPVGRDCPAGDGGSVLGVLARPSTRNSNLS